MALPDVEESIRAAGTLIAGLASITPQYDVILCDVWGVVHNGRARYEAACNALARFREGGGTVVLITNAPRPSAPIREQLDRLLVPGHSYDSIVTSGDVTLGFVAARPNVPLHHIGPPRDLVLFDEVAAEGGAAPVLVELEAAAYVVCTGLFHDDVETPDDYDQRLAVMKSRAMPMVCANPDLVVHVGDKLLFCAGALAERYETIGGQVEQAGKPYAPIYERALSLAAEIRGGRVPLARVLAIGDAIRTDIAGAGMQGIDSLFVTAGIHRDELHPADAEGRAAALDAAALEQFLGNALHKPRYAIPSLVW